jgi:hypothetical protein
VSWAGTDSNGIYFKSSAKRFNQFSYSQIRYFAIEQKQQVVEVVD